MIFTSSDNHVAGVDHVVRMSDSEVWSSAEMKRFLEKEGIKLINYTQQKRIQKKRQKMIQTH